MSRNPKASGFYAMFNGQIASCQMEGADNLYVKYSFVRGKDWEYIHGLDNGISQIARKGESSNQVVAWNYPLDVTLRSTNVHGWPQLVLSVYGINGWGKDVIRGYGNVHLPTTPGRHVRYVRLYTPVSSSLCRQVTSWFLSNPPEFFDANFIAQGKGREVTRVQSNGVVKVVVNVMTKNMRDWGYSVSGERGPLVDRTNQMATAQATATIAQQQKRAQAARDRAEEAENEENLLNRDFNSTGLRQRPVAQSMAMSTQQQQQQQAPAAAAPISASDKNQSAMLSMLEQERLAKVRARINGKGDAASALTSTERRASLGEAVPLLGPRS